MKTFLAHALQVCTSGIAAASDPRVESVLASITEGELRQMVEQIAVPRHFEAEAEANRRTGEWVARQFESYGYRVTFEGQWRNVLALPDHPVVVPLMLVGAHYDSVPGTPGADDNASAVAAMLSCARVVAKSGDVSQVCFVAFNREEDGLAGSSEFVENFLSRGGLDIRAAHILEMVGYCDTRPGSQRLPPELPLKLRDTGDFLGLIANSPSASMVDDVLTQAATYLPDFPVIGLKVHLGLEHQIAHLERSDHAPFWHEHIPALMWTDTSEFRNPHYHLSTDTPDTLDYAFLRHVTQLLTATILTKSTP